jgi:hypothetical protein
MPSSDRADEAVDAADLGKRSGALYESMLVVWTSSTGAEILCLSVPVVEALFLSVPKEDLAMVLLRCGALSPSASCMLCFTLRVVNARARDILADIPVWFVEENERRVLPGRCFMAAK